MAENEHNTVKKILDQIEEKIVVLRAKARALANSKEVEQQIIKLEQHKKQVEKELKLVSGNLQERWKDGFPHLKTAAAEIGRAVLSFIKSPADSTTPAKRKTSTRSKKKPSATVKKTTEKAASTSTNRTSTAAATKAKPRRKKPLAKKEVSAKKATSPVKKGQ